MPTYEHRQFSPWIVGFLAIVALAPLFGRDGQGLFLGFALAAVICVGFIQLTTRVDGQGVSWGFTFGVPGGSIAFGDIADVQVTKTAFWEGFGIHWTFIHGWLWNVSGYQGVMICKRDGGRITLGTDDPQGLYAAISQNARLGS